jgi:hypothetical protein
MINVIQPYLTLTKDIISILATLIAIFTGIWGYNKWKKQLKTKNEYDLAKKYLHAVYKVRNAIAKVRNPYHRYTEIMQAMKQYNIEGNPMEDEVISTLSLEALYKIRLDNSENALIELDSIVTEAEVLWGNDAKKIKEKLRYYHYDLSCKIEEYIKQRYPNSPRICENANNEIKNALNGCRDDDDRNPFSKRITEAIKDIEDFLKPHLKL